MKKIFVCMLLTLAMLISFAACRGKDGGETTTTELAPEADSINIEDISSALEGLETAPIEPASEVETMPSGEEIDVQVGSNGRPSDSQFDKYFLSMLKGDKYTLKFTLSTNDDSLGGINIPVVMARSGDDSYCSMQMKIAALGSLETEVVNVDGKCYMIIPQLKSYMIITESEAESQMLFNPSDLGELKYVKTSKVTVGGKEYICEEYQTGPDSMKFYFSDNALSRIEITSSNIVSVMSGITISDDADSSLFAPPPQGYINQGNAAGIY